MTKYSYTAKDQSILTPFIYGFFVAPLMKIIPYGMPANIITFISNSFILIAFIIAYINHKQGTYFIFWLIPLLSFCYIIGDFSDGIQARRTNTGSPLGEYFDHFLDSFVTGFLTGIILLCMRVENPFVLLLPYQFLYIGQIGTFWERYKKGIMSFAKFSTSEGTLAITIMSWLTSFSFIREQISKKIIFNLSVPEMIVLFCFFLAGVSGLAAITRSGKFSFKLWIHILFSVIISAAVVLFTDASIALTSVFITFYNVLFIESILAGTSLKTKESMPDLAVPLSCVLFFFFKEQTSLIVLGQTIYLSIRIVLRFIIFFNKHKQYWVWINKKPQNKETEN